MVKVSAYPRNAMLVFLAGFGIAWLLLVVALVLIFCLSGKLHGGRHLAIVASVLIVTTHAITTVGLALIAGFGFYPQYVSFLISAAVWIPVNSLGMSLTSTAWRTTLLAVRSCRRVAGADDASKGGCFVAAKSVVLAAGNAALKKPIVFLILSTSTLVVTLAVNLALSEVCYCTNPTEMTTWASRRSDPHYCTAGQFCHLYPLVGRTARVIRLVGHMVVDDKAARPQATHATVCATTLGAAGTCVGGSPWTVTGRVRDHAHIVEDYRYLSHITLTNLTGETYYAVNVSFTFGTTGRAAETKSIVFSTVPDENSTTTVRMIAGGDVHQGRQFTQLLLGAIVNEPRPHLIAIGGDLSYANNMRTCYLRWDEFLRDLSAIRTGSGVASLPVMTIPGNHESGGYLHQASRDDYYFYTQYFPQYDVDFPPDADLSLTYHSHLLGSNLLLVGLDSGLMIPVADQTEYLRQQLASVRDLQNPATNKFVIVMHHNPAYPCYRSLDSGTTPDVREKLLPIYDEFKVPLVLEFHDHSYKRTWPMFGGAVRAADGTVFVGDGALGVFDKSREPDHSRTYLRQSSGQNYIQVIRAYVNGTAAIDILGKNRKLIDTFSVRLR